MPWDFESDVTVRIDADEILDYVKDNKEWFLDKLNIAKKEDLYKKVKDLFRDFYNEFDHVRRLRDSSHEYETDEKVRMYEWAQQIEEELLNAMEI